MNHTRELYLPPITFLALTLLLAGAPRPLLAAAPPAPGHVEANLPPDTWFSGPDPAFYPVVPGSGGQRYVDIANWSALPPFPGSLLSCDSLTMRPSLRPVRKTFFEFYGNRVYVRSENDTVNRNSFVVVASGGFDPDSPYPVVVQPGDPALVDTVDCAAAGTPWTIRPDGPNGSPIGFRMRAPVLLDPAGPFTNPSQSGLYPNFDPASVFRVPAISGYSVMFQSGKAYLVTRSQDGDGLLDPTFPTAASIRQLADSVDQGLATDPVSLAKRAKILTFYVNRNPFLRYGDPAFTPKPPAYNGGATYTYPTRTLQLNLLATDPDPYDNSFFPWPGGGPTPTGELTWTVTVHGHDSGGHELSYTAPTSNSPGIVINLATAAPGIVDNNLTLEVQLCDCRFCAQSPGSGRCVTSTIPVRVDTPVSALASLVSAEATPSLARVQWAISGAGPARIERSTAVSAWQWMAESWPDGTGRVTFEDRSVVAGERYGYRVSLPGADQWTVADEAWLEVPRSTALALEGVRPNPGAGDLILGFSLPDDQSASLEIFDASGRRVWTRAASFGAGRRLLGLGHGFAPGLYVVRLSQGARVLTSKFAVVR